MQRFTLQLYRLAIGFVFAINLKPTEIRPLFAQHTVLRFNHLPNALPSTIVHIIGRPAATEIHLPQLIL
jgi:hypothetical protein